jgi:hypothetical protein
MSVMKYDVGIQYDKDYPFKASARLHQSRYRASALLVDYDEYGNRLTDADAKSLLNYYDGFNIHSALRERYPNYSKVRDADMLRSEHIPFNLFPPLAAHPDLTRQMIENAFGIPCNAPFVIRCEYAPEPKGNYLDDGTAFDAYILASNGSRRVGIGIEVKYTEQAYRIGVTERKNVDDPESRYWQVTRESGAFIDDRNPLLGTDEMRQIWRNHLLGLSMLQRDELDEFYSITLYPEGNEHFQHAIPAYRDMLTEHGQSQVLGCTFEKFIESIDGDEEILKWKQYLTDRYLVRS